MSLNYLVHDPRDGANRTIAKLGDYLCEVLYVVVWLVILSGKCWLWACQQPGTPAPLGFAS